MCLVYFVVLWQVALQNNVTLTECLDIVRDARAKGLTIAVVLMGYLNPFLAYGLNKLVHNAHRNGETMSGEGGGCLLGFSSRASANTTEFTTFVKVCAVRVLLSSSHARSNGCKRQCLPPSVSRSTAPTVGAFVLPVVGCGQPSLQHCSFGC